MDKNSLITKIAALNPCVKFAIDNYDMLCCAHTDKVVMIMNSIDILAGYLHGPGAYVAKIFDSTIQAMQYTHAMQMGHVPYALVECNGSEVEHNIMWSIGCKMED